MTSGRVAFASARRANGPSADKKPCPRRVKAANGPLWPSRRLDPIPRPWGWGAGRSLILNRVKRRHRSWCRIGRLAECRAGDERDRRRTGKVVSRCPHALSGLKSSRPPPQASPPLVAQARVPAPLGRAGFTASNLVRLAQRVALQTRGLQPEGPCSERLYDRGYNPTFCRQPAKGHWMPAHLVVG